MSYTYSSSIMVPRTNKRRSLAMLSIHWYSSSHSQQKVLPCWYFDTHQVAHNPKSWNLDDTHQVCSQQKGVEFGGIAMIKLFPNQCVLCTCNMLTMVISNKIINFNIGWSHVLCGQSVCDNYIYIFFNFVNLTTGCLSHFDWCKMIVIHQHGFSGQIIILA
jgi:hypothetical protein